MDIRKIKEAKKIHNKMTASMQKIKALIGILEERNCEDYPINFLFVQALKMSRNASEKILKSSDILYNISKKQC